MRVGCGAWGRGKPRFGNVQIAWEWHHTTGPANDEKSVALLT